MGTPRRRKIPARVHLLRVAWSSAKQQISSYLMSSCTRAIVSMVGRARCSPTARCSTGTSTKVEFRSPQEVTNEKRRTPCWIVHTVRTARLESGEVLSVRSPRASRCAGHSCAGQSRTWRQHGCGGAQPVGPWCEQIGSRGQRRCGAFARVIVIKNTIRGGGGGFIDCL